LQLGLGVVFAGGQREGGKGGQGDYAFHVFSVSIEGIGVNMGWFGGLSRDLLKARPSETFSDGLAFN
jgi:hypothetical protein